MISQAAQPANSHPFLRRPGRFLVTGFSLSMATRSFAVFAGSSGRTTTIVYWRNNWATGSNVNPAAVGATVAQGVWGLFGYSVSGSGVGQRR